MSDNIRSVTIVGASGTIGSLVGGLIAQCGLHVNFISRSMSGAKNGLKRAVNQARSEVITRHIECWDYEHGLEPALGDADLIIESVAEDFETKCHIYNLIEKYRMPGTIIGTTTSSLPLTRLLENRSEDFSRHFMSTHFYNPPGRMSACEVACTKATEPTTYEKICRFLKEDLRRDIIQVHNIPAFAGNRIAFLLFNRITCLAEEYGVEMMEYLIGPYTGRLMPPLATLDLVGLDVHTAIINSLKMHTSEGANGLESPAYVKSMISNGLIGNKAGQGFYKKLEDGTRMYIDPSSLDYIPAIEPHVQFVEKAKRLIHMAKYREAFEAIVDAKGVEAEIVKSILANYLSSAFSLIGEVTDKSDGIKGIDRVMASGFNWASPSVIVNLLGGVSSTINFISTMGCEVPDTLCEACAQVTTSITNCGRYFIAK
jgi:3-hydroxyacyl-CoA dehydrogenase